MVDSIIILICTHNRSQLLERVVRSINTAKRPSCNVELVVVANACSDNTVEFLKTYPTQAPDQIPLTWLEEPAAGKSRALNLAIPLLGSGLIAMVDDDHRIHPDYLISIYRSALDYPESDIYCGQIIPDWEGTEEAWIHDCGVYAIYPLPIPHYTLGTHPRQLFKNDRTPGGGNLVIKREVFERVGLFSTQLGPQGHDLGGGEDTEFMRRAIRRGIRLQYCPDIIQYHYVDTERLRLRYLLQKAYHRSRSAASVQLRNKTQEASLGPRIPRYLWRKMVVYALRTLVSLYWPETRFYLMRSASTLGELSAHIKDRNASQ